MFLEMAAGYLKSFFKKTKFFVMRVNASKVNKMSEEKPCCQNLVRGYLKREEVVDITYFIE